MSARHPAWAAAESLLRRMRPGSTGFLPDQIAGLAPQVWTPFPIEDPSPEEVTQAFLAYCAPLVGGTLVVVTDDCWRPDVGPFEVSADDLPAFAASYPEVYDSAFISGDTIVLSPATATVIVVHHDELIATLRSVTV